MTLYMFGIITRTRGESEVDFEMDGYTEFHDWQGRHDLHAWMQRLYERKGGNTRSFWKANLLLTSRDLDRLERRIRIQEVSQQVLDIFGAAAAGTAIEDDKRFVARARRALSMGLNVVYAAWW